MGHHLHRCRCGMGLLSRDDNYRRNLYGPEHVWLCVCRGGSYGGHYPNTSLDGLCRNRQLRRALRLCRRLRILRFAEPDAIPLSLFQFLSLNTGQRYDTKTQHAHETPQ